MDLKEEGKRFWDELEDLQVFKRLRLRTQILRVHRLSSRAVMALSRQTLEYSKVRQIGREDLTGDSPSLN
jgi:hypothetical protein